MTPTDIPGQILGDHPLVNWLNRLRRAILRRTLLPGPNYRIRQTENGITLDIGPQIGNRAASGVSVRIFRLKQVNMNSLTVNEIVTWDRNTNIEGLGPDEKIAKPHELRADITSEEINGATVEYVYLSGETRLALWSDQTVFQRILPPYHEQQLVWAIRAQTHVIEDGQELEWLELNQGRVWSRLLML